VRRLPFSTTMNSNSGMRNGTATVMSPKSNSASSTVVPEAVDPNHHAGPLQPQDADMASADQELMQAAEDFIAVWKQTYRNATAQEKRESAAQLRHTMEVMRANAPAAPPMQQHGGHTETQIDHMPLAKLTASVEEPTFCATAETGRIPRTTQPISATADEPEARTGNEELADDEEEWEEWDEQKVAAELAAGVRTASPVGEVSTVASTCRVASGERARAPAEALTFGNGVATAATTFVPPTTSVSVPRETQGSRVATTAAASGTSTAAGLATGAPASVHEQANPFSAFVAEPMAEDDWESLLAL